MDLEVLRIASHTVAPREEAVRAATEPTWPVGPKTITGSMREEIGRGDLITKQAAYMMEVLS